MAAAAAAAAVTDAASVTTYDSVESVDAWVPPETTIVEKRAAAPLVVPYGTRDALTDRLIRNGMRMADFSNERARGRFYTEKSFKSLDRPQRNPFDRSLINEVLYYVAAIARKAGGCSGRRGGHRDTRRRSRGRRQTRRQTRHNWTRR